MKFDLNLFALDDQLPLGLYATSAPKRTARGREEDQVIVLFTQQGDQPLVGRALMNWQAKSVEVFYTTPGSVTSGMRAMIESLNQKLFEENKHLAEDQLKKSLEVSLCVIHHETLLVAQSGRSRVLVVSGDGQTDFIDRDANQLGLGVHEIPRVSFFQKTIKPGDVVVLGNEIPEDLVPLLISPAIYPLRAVLKDRIAIEAPVFLVQFVSGDGHVLRGALPTQEPAPVENVEVKTEEVVELEKTQELVVDSQLVEEILPEPVEESGSLAQDLFNLPVAPELPPAVEVEIETTEPEPSTSAPTEPDLTTQPTQSILIRKVTEPTPAEPQAPEPETVVKVQPVIEQKPTKARLADNQELQKMKKDTLTGVAKSAGWLKRVETKAGKAVFSKVGPIDKKNGDNMGLPAAAKLIIAILVPLFMVALAALVFFTQSHADDVAYLTRQAKVYYQNAEQVTDPNQQRAAWQEALVWIRQASAVSNDPELDAMRISGETALDAMDGAVRLSFVRSFDSALFPDLQIQKVIVLNYDLYLFDSNAGQVLHFNKKGNSYEQDIDFRCGPGTYGNVSVGKLVSMSEIQINNPARAPIVAIDAEGTTVYCSIGNAPVAAKLSPPEGGFGEIKMMTVDSGRMMILDPERNAIWIYRGLSTQFDRAADSYFEEMPVNLRNAVEIAVNRDELFILHGDGHSSHYIASNITGLVDGQDPLLYSDIRQDTPPISFTHIKFGRLSYSPPPDPSIYYLDSKTAELYQFSLKLNLNRVLRSGSVQGALPGGEVNAFSVASNQMVFLAFGNQLYHATLP
ncbi:MAG: hypothetical protein WBI14_06365 [Anaerolineaceae bacterium]